MNKISAVVLTKNEEDKIEKCLRALLFCDEILVIDDFSSDNTVTVIKNLKEKEKSFKNVKIIQRKIDNDFASQRNFALNKVKNSWVLFVDADEIVTQQLAQEILTADTGKHKGYYIKRRDIFAGKLLKYGETGYTKLLRFARKDAGSWVRKVHEVWIVKNKLGELKNELLHFSHDDLEEFTTKINKWSTLHAKENGREGKRTGIVKILLLPTGKFKLNYIIKKGFRDGTHGFVFAVMMSFHSFLSWSKLWLTQKENI
jgi:glycosyltransferase involved in cell wall biosynthesis